MQSRFLSVCGLAVASLFCFASRSVCQAPASESAPASTTSSPAIATKQDAPPAENTPAAAKKGKKEKPVKDTPLTIVHGVLTVDGWTAKADLNYAIPDIKFLYVWVPGTGTYVISNRMFAGATEVPEGFSGTTLTVTANNHRIQIASEKQLLHNKKESAFVSVDQGYKDTARAPRLGYGDKPVGPYAYPGSPVPTSSADASKTTSAATTSATATVAAVPPKLN